MSGSFRGLASRVAITSLVTVGLLAAGEVSLRTWAYFFRHPYQRFDSRLEMITLVPNYREVVEGKLLEVNSRGLRAGEFAVPKPPRTSRIIMLGDSVTFGRAGEDCHYPGVLQRLFDADQRGRVEVINAGVEGYNSRDARQLLERRLLSYSPDMVTVLIGWNDLVKQDPARPMASALETRLAYAMYDVYLVKFWRRLIYLHLRPLVLHVQTSLSREEEAGFRTYVPVVYKENLEKIVETAEAAGSQVVLFTLPSVLREGISQKDIRKLYFPHYTYNVRTFILLHDRYNEAIRLVGRTTGVPVVDLQEAVRGRESELFMDTAHLECAGYQIVGRYLHEVLPDLMRRGRQMALINGR